jgi:3-deoxy-D-manno-octulosonic-acid transferase
MPWLLNALYLLILLLLSPWLLWRRLRTGRYRSGVAAKLFGLSRPLVPSPSGPVVWFHGVSVGEVHLLRQVVAACRQRFPTWQCVVSATTDTGLAEARKAFAELPVFVFPFDFSWAVKRTLRQVAPALIVLAEGELWPNFLRAAQRRGVPIALINGRLSPRSFARHRLLGPLSRGLLRRFDLLAMQTPEYAGYVKALGASPGRVRVTGSVKWDGVERNRGNAETTALRRLFALADDDLVWVAGSTQAPEEEIVLRIFGGVKDRFPRLRLILVPRHPERFDEVARLVERNGLGCIRWSRLPGAAATPTSAVVLVDTIGKLKHVWGLADLAFVGGSLDGKRGGQNMLEPAAYGAAVLFGPHVWNFRDAATRLIEARGAVQVMDDADLAAEAPRLLASREQRQGLGQAARRLVLEQQGATARTVELLGELLARGTQRAAA